MELREIARFAHAGDVRRMLVGLDGGSLVVREDVSGPSALVAYGEEEYRLRMVIGPDALSDLLARVGFSGEEGLWAYLSDEGRGLVDLMDLCDGLGISYAFSSMGPKGSLQFRPA
ncbi:hypothetical protein B5F84_08525 [Olsenella sp. An290]|nr:hypothetical protein B5F84_08525 [Olsenella sp. An290]